MAESELTPKFAPFIGMVRVGELVGRGSLGATGGSHFFLSLGLTAGKRERER